MKLGMANGYALSSANRQKAQPSFCGIKSKILKKSNLAIAAATVYTGNIIYKVAQHDSGLINSAKEFSSLNMTRELSKSSFNPEYMLETTLNAFKALGKMLYHTIF